MDSVLDKAPASVFDRLKARTLVTLVAVATVVIGLGISFATPRGTSYGDERVIGIATYLAMAFVVLVVARRAGLDWRRLFGAAPTRAELPLLTVIAPVILLTFAAAYAVFIPLSYIWPHFVTRHLLAPTPFADVTTIPQWIALVIAGCVFAPIVEETIFRGLLMQRWARRWGTPTGVILSSLLFAVLHDEWIGKIVFGVAMCALYLRTRRLWVPIAAHAINNAIIIVPLLGNVLAHTRDAGETLPQFRADWWIGVLAFATGLVLLQLYVQRLWPNGQLRAALTGPTPYDAPDLSAVAP